MNSMSQISLFSLGLVLMGCDVPAIQTQQARTPVPQPVQEAVVEPEGPNEPPPVTSTPRPFTAKDPVKGKKSRAAGQVASAIGGTRFYVEYENLRLNIVHALDLYWGEHGEYPQSHDEFIEKIVKFNNLQLPELDPGVEYIYDPQDHVLKIYRPEGSDSQSATPEQG